MSWLGADLVKWVLDWLWGKISAAISVFIKDKENTAVAKSEADQDTAKAAKLKPDSNQKEVSDAIDDTLKHF